MRASHSPDTGEGLTYSDRTSETFWFHRYVMIQRSLHSPDIGECFTYTLDETNLETLTLSNQLILKPEHLWDALCPNPIDLYHS